MQDTDKSLLTIKNGIREIHPLDSKLYRVWSVLLIYYEDAFTRLNFKYCLLAADSSTPPLIYLR